MSEVRKSLKITDNNYDSRAKRGIRVLLTDEMGEHEKMIYPLLSQEADDFYQELKCLQFDYLPAVEGYVNGGQTRYALTDVGKGNVLASCRDKISTKICIEMMKDLADAMQETHEEGFAFGGLSARDVLVNEEGLLLPPPAYPATDSNIALDFAGVGGICYELLTGIEYRPGMSISPDTLPESVPYGARRVICNATSKDEKRQFNEAKELIRAFDSRKVDMKRNEPVPAPMTVKPVQTESRSEEPGKSERRPVKKVKRRRDKRKLILFGAGAVGIAVLVLAVVLIVNLLGGNKDGGYGAMEEKAAIAIQEGRYSEVDSIVAEALIQNPTQLGAYYYKTIALYKSESYQETVEFIENNIMGKQFENKASGDEMRRNIYYMLGCSYFKINDYENAYKKLASAQNAGYDKKACAEIMSLASVRLENKAALDAVFTEETMGAIGAAYQEACKLEKNGEPAGAAAKYNEVISALGANHEIGDFLVLHTVDCYQKTQSYDEGINICENFIQQGISMKQAQKLWLKKAMLLKDKAKRDNSADLYKTARSAFETVAKLGYEVNLVKYEIGECSLWVGERDRAKEVLQEVAASDDEVYAPKAASLMRINGLN